MNELTISCLSIRFTCLGYRQVTFPLSFFRLLSFHLQEGTGIDFIKQQFCFSDVRPLSGRQGKEASAAAPGNINLYRAEWRCA